MNRVTRPMVRQIDRVGAVGVTVGGVGIIAAVLVIMVYLAATVLPLFRSGVLYGSRGGKVAFAATPVDAVADEYKGLLVALLADGNVQPVDLQTFTALPPIGDASGRQTAVVVTAVSAINESGQVAIGYADGSVQLGTVGTKVEYVEGKEIDVSTAEGKKAAALKPGERGVYGGGYAEMTPLGQLRVVRPDFSLNKAAGLNGGSGAVVRVDTRSNSSSQFLLTAREDGTVEFSRVTTVRPMGGGGKPRTTLSSVTVAFAAPAGKAKVPDYLFSSGDGVNLFALWNDGTLQRYVLQPKGDDEEFVVAETERVLEGSRSVTTARMLLGSRTLVVADDGGDVLGVFAARRNTMSTPDGWHMAVAHTLTGLTGGEGVRAEALGITLRDRCVVIGDSKGGLTVRHMTSEKRVAQMGAVLNGPVAITLATPKGDGVVAIDKAGGIALLDLDAGYAEASFKSVFGKIWYEGDTGPSYTYQAATGEDTAETKYSNIPLVFGTIKSTVYAMLFAVPLAVAAALYTSEFLHAKVKNRVKPVIEMMASLPSVVLGFLASIVIAPLFRDQLPGVVMAFFMIPVGVLAGAYLWQLVPLRVTTRVGSLQHLSMVLGVLLLSAAASVWLGGVVQRSLFKPSDADVLVLAGSVQEVPREQYPAALRDVRSLSASDVLPYRGQGLYYSAGRVVRPVGSLSDPKVRAVVEQNNLARPDMRAWLDGLIGTPHSGWVLVMTPVGVLLAAAARSKLLDGYLSGLMPRVGTAAASTEIGKFVLTLGSGIGIASLLAAVFTSSGLDARDWVFGTYSQRNTLVVGVAMGFAIIPIIYTISEDALSAVPGQLRSASLGCGATRWQTATRVVLPIAMSGIFSAVMIGLGRAAGETMIVLMATGNTPNMDWNVFSGFRTLSANIATEMPEAAVGGAHYRMLFLGALLLFALTFIVNTLAEIVRQRVRRARAAL